MSLLLTISATLTVLLFTSITAFAFRCHHMLSSADHLQLNAITGKAKHFSWGNVEKHFDEVETITDSVRVTITITR